jgi:hypothetical protein
MDTTQEADFGDTPVYFDARGIANVLSLYQLGQKFKVTYDSTDRGGVFKVLTPAGVVEFKPTQKGLHVLNLKHNPDAAFILVNDADLAYGKSRVPTVRQNYEGFTKRQVQQATHARRIMGMIGAPTESEFQSLIRLNLLKDCPITNSDIINAHKIFGPDLANIRGKMVRRKPRHVNTELVDIPQALADNKKNVTLVADVMFINGVPFLVSSSRYILLTTIEHAPDCKAPKLGYLIHRIMNTYARAGFNVHTILMDNEFEKIKDHVHATLNTPAESEHVGEIERRIWVIKERCRGIICTLPYAQIPWIMLIYLLHRVWLCGSIIFLWLMVSPTDSALARFFNLINWKSNITALHLLALIAKSMKTMLLLTVCSRAAYLLFASAPLETNKAPTVSSISRRDLSSNAAVLSNSLLLILLSSMSILFLTTQVYLPHSSSLTATKSHLLGQIIHLHQQPSILLRW